MDNKTEFYKAWADWIENQSGFPVFTLSEQIFKASIPDNVDNEIFENLTNLIGKVNFKTTHLRGGCHNEDMSGGPFLTGHLTGYLFLERKFNR